MILNLHYFGLSSEVQLLHQDGFYKGDIADNKYNLVRFWKEISDRYKDEWIILGYDLINEPNVRDGFSEEALYNVYEQIIQMFRKNQDKHIVFVSEPVNNFEYWLRGKREAIPFKKLNDSNVVYQFHWYQPIEFTHQGFFEVPYFELGCSYPFQKIVAEYKGGFYNTPLISSTQGEWKYYVSGWSDLVNKSNCRVDVSKDLFNLSLCANQLNGRVWFDEVKLEQRHKKTGLIKELFVPNASFIDPNAFVGWVATPEISEYPAYWHGLWNEDTFGLKFSLDRKGSYFKDGSGAGLVDGRGVIWGGRNQWANWNQSGGALSTYYPLGDDYEYQASAWIKTEANNTYGIGINYNIHDVKIFNFDKEMIRGLILNYYLDWSVSKNVPLYCGEFGTTRPSRLSSATFEENGQIKWVKDVREVLDEYHINWTYHAYKSYSPRADLFGLYDIENGEDFEVIKALKTI